MTSDDLHRRLAELGGAPVPIGAARLDRLERRVRRGIERDDRGVVVAFAPPRRRPLGAVLVAGVAACVLALAIVTLGVVFGDDDGVVIAAADDVTVMLPDGELVEGAAGVELPDGAELQVIGFVEVGGRRYGPGTYVVVGGRIERRSDAGAGERDDSDDPDDAASDGRAAPSPPGDTTTPTGADAPATTAAPPPTRAPDDEPTVVDTATPPRPTDVPRPTRPDATVETRPSTTLGRLDAPTVTAEPTRTAPAPTTTPSSTAPSTSTTAPPSRDRPTGRP